MAGFLFLQAVTIPLFIHAHEVPTFYMWAVLFGTGFGGPMPVYAMLFREYFGIRHIGSILGVFFMIAALGMGSGSMMGGVLYNVFGSYAVPFFTSTTTGLIAALLALTLPPVAKREPAVTPQVVLAS
jgi:MFS family permease